jgi:hypothetical protein
MKKKTSPTKKPKKNISDLGIISSRKYEVSMPSSDLVKLTPQAIKYVEKKTEKKQTKEEAPPSKLETLSEEGAGERKKEDGVVLETTVAAAPRPEEVEAAGRAYELRLATEPTPNIYTRVRSIYETVKEHGTLNEEQSADLQHLRNAMWEKERDIQAGRYSATNSVVRQLSLAEKIVEDLLGTYQR